MPLGPFDISGCLSSAQALCEKRSCQVPSYKPATFVGAVYRRQGHQVYF
jgi:hypothetical protein